MAQDHHLGQAEGKNLFSDGKEYIQAADEAARNGLLEKAMGMYLDVGAVDKLNDLKEQCVNELNFEFAAKICTALRNRQKTDK